MALIRISIVEISIVAMNVNYNDVYSVIRVQHAYGQPTCKVGFLVA
jgi:hypothetical protein